MSLLRRLSALFPGRRFSAAEDSSTSTEDVTVLIVGAGSTGLALAQGLKKAGIPCTIVEKNPSIDFQPRDWNMGLHWGAAALQSLMPEVMWSRIQSVQVDPSTPTAESDCIKFLNGATGEVLTTIPAQKFYRLRRRKLRHLLAEGLDIRYNHKIAGIDYSGDGNTATAYFDGDERITASLIVGADGARSKVRDLLLGPKDGSIRTVPYCATWIQAKYTAEQARFLRTFHPLYIAAINPAGFFSFFGLHDASDPDPASWTFFFYISWYSPLEEQESTRHWDNARRLAQVKQFATHFTDPWRSAFEWLPDDQEVWYMSLTDFDPGLEEHRWDNHDGRVTLAGDAAHAMTYQRGQGLNHSVTDGGRLATAIQEFFYGDKTRGEAIAEYEEEMIERAGGEVRMSTTNTEMVHDWEKVLMSPVMRSGMVKVQDISAAEGSKETKSDDMERTVEQRANPV